MTTECTTEARGQNPVDARINALVDSVSTWSALFVGALTVVLANAVADALPLAEFHRALALFPVTVAVLYVLLWAAHRLERRGER